jgi:uncharacterized protein (DUF362 family)
MMIKIKLLSKRNLRILLVPLLAALVSLDFLLAPDGTETGTFKPESEFEVVTSDTTTVGLVPSDFQDLADPISRDLKPTDAQVEEMVRKAIELQGGLDGVVEPGDKVMIKVNLVGGNSPSGQGENTDATVVKALIRILYDFTGGDVSIQVAEGSARINDDPTEPGSVWANSGYTALLTEPSLAGIDFSLLNLNQSLEDMEEVDLGEKGTSAIQGSKYHVHKAELEADVYIAVPVLKIHDTGITNALKLQVGSAPGCMYGYNKTAGTAYYKHGLYHNVEQRLWTPEMIVDLSSIADIDFVVVDALMCLESYKTYQGDNQVRMNTIVAGADPVAVDHVCTKLFCLNPDDIAHITLAEKMGLGTNDPDRIVVKGATIEEVRRKVKKNQTDEGKFGQSNRTWILSQAFDGSSVEEDFIADEGDLRPETGVNGWSEPIYFFDDRIDLLSYYQGKTNMVSYAFTYFDSPADKEAELWLGTHEGMEIFLNGEMVYSYYSTNLGFDDAERGGFVKNIQLLQGENALLIKTLNRSGDYSFTLNICDHEGPYVQKGNRVEGLEFYTKSRVTGVNSPKLADPADSGELLVYPNPASEKIWIRANVPAGAPATLQIHDAAGRLVRSLHTSGTPDRPWTWDLQNAGGRRVKPGVYICTLEWTGKKMTAKMIIE